MLTYDNSTGYISLKEATGGGGIAQGATEGTFSPTVVPSGGGTYTSVTYNSLNVGYYTRLGDMVTVQGRLKLGGITLGSKTGNVAVAGFPFTPSNTIGSQMLSTGYAVGFSLIPTGMRTQSSSAHFVLATGTAPTSNLIWNQVTATADLIFSGSYITSDA